MNIRMCCGLGVLAMAAAAQVSVAQAQESMAKDKAMAKTFTGCVAAGPTADTFTLTHASVEMPMAKDGMAKDGMMKDGMKKESMDAHMEKMASQTFAIASSSVELKGHVGHQVALTATETSMDMAKHDAMGKSDAMAKHDETAKPDAMGKSADAMAKHETMDKSADAMAAKHAAMAAPTKSLTVSALRMIAAKCTM